MNQVPAMSVTKGMDILGDPCRFNTRLQSILSGEPGPDARASLVACLHEFVARATSLTATIVAERSMPGYPDAASIKPCQLGGVAGGTKYIYDGILFKFVEDPIPPGSRGSYLYGGGEPRLDRAAKAAANELRACGILNRFVFERRVAGKVRAPLFHPPTPPLRLTLIYSYSCSRTLY